MSKYAIINKQTNVCENICMDERPIEQIPMPETHFLIDILKVPNVDWIYNRETMQWYTLDSFGQGGIDDIWDGEKLIQPKPPEAE